MSARFVVCVAALLATGPLAAQAKPAPARAPAAPKPARTDSGKATATRPPDSTATPQLVREAFSYEGGGRDPFMSL
ncbi:MAG TPA: hypothetical protein VJN39_12565, partial [Gemmatimonadales bacterium]|nr:hypothetical protein [Gemmatimonadales bacterium]